MNELLLGLVVVVLTPGGIAFLWLRKKMNLSPEAAAAVAPPEGPKPANHDEALISLATQLAELREDVTNHRVYLPRVVDWGHRGWRHAPAGEREPLPHPPKGIEL